MSSAKMHVLIAGSGLAAAEALLALDRLARDRVAITVLTPDSDFGRLPVSPRSPFLASCWKRRSLDDTAANIGVDVRRGRIVAVRPSARAVLCDDGRELRYDALLVAIGAVQLPPLRGELAFGRPGSVECMRGLVQDLESGYIGSLGLVVDSRTTWSLPLYELALMTGERAYAMCADVRLVLVTAERRPLELFGPNASGWIERELSRLGVELTTGAQAAIIDGGTVARGAAGPPVTVDRVITLPTLIGPAIDGLPHDDDGFLPVDRHGRVHGADGVHAAGDVVACAVKHGGLACRQADAAAEMVAAAAGVDIDPEPYAPIVEACLVTERIALQLRRDLDLPAHAPHLATPAVQKISGRELSRLGLDTTTSRLLSPPARVA